MDGQGTECKCGQFYHNRPDWTRTLLAHYTMRSLSLSRAKPDRAWRYALIHSTTKVKERVELYLYSPSDPSWPFLGRTLPSIFTTFKSLNWAQNGARWSHSWRHKMVPKIDFPSSICCWVGPLWEGWSMGEEEPKPAPWRKRDPWYQRMSCSDLSRN